MFMPKEKVEDYKTT